MPRLFSPLILFVAVAPLLAEPASLTIFSETPAAKSDEGYGVGNGRLGALVYGGLPKTMVVLNESSIVTGSAAVVPVDGAGARKRAAELCRSGDHAGAGAALRAATPDSDAAAGANVPAGLLTVEYLDVEKTAGYRRELDMGSGVISEFAEAVSGKNKYKFRTEVVASPASDVVALRLSADRPVRVALSLTRPTSILAGASGNELALTGAAGGEGGTLFDSRVRVIAGKDAEIKADGGRLIVSGSREIFVFVSITTDFDPLHPETPSPRVRAAVNAGLLDEAVRFGWGRVRGEAGNYFRDGMTRCALDLGDTPEAVRKLSTAKRLARVASGEKDPDLFEQMFQFGRYCTVAGSRAATNTSATLPPGLRGLWNAGFTPGPFATAPTGVDADMLQWPAEVTGLGEYRQVFTEFVRGLEPAGKALAKAVGAEGFCFGPAGDFHGRPVAGSVADSVLTDLLNGSRLAAHCVDRYRFGGDKNELRKALPLLRENARFILTGFTRDEKSGEWIAPPGISPRNAFRDAAGKPADVSAGCAYDQELGRAGLADYLYACRELAASKDELYARAESVLPKIAKPRVGSDGRLQEWREPFAEVSPGNPYASHAQGLFPDDAFDLRGTPEIAAALKKSLDVRVASGAADSGPGAARFANLYARLGESGRAMTLLNRILAKYTKQNLSDSGEAFRLDTGAGFTSAVAECLIASRTTEEERRVVTLLPALPTEWKSGTVDGLRARGGLVVNLKWMPGGVEADFVALRDGRFRIRYREAFKDLELRAGDAETVKFP